MQISSLLSKYLDPSSGARRSEPQEVAGRTSSGEEAASAPPASASSSRAAREILGRYDVTDITPRQFSEMIQSLRQAGAVTEEQFQELSSIRIDLDLQGVDPDESLDLLEFYTDQLQDAQDDQAAPLISTIERRLDWLRKAAMIQSGPEAPELDSLA